MENRETKKWICSEVSVNSLWNPWSQFSRRSGRLRWEGFAKKERCRYAERIWHYMQSVSFHNYCSHSHYCHTSTCAVFPASRVMLQGSTARDEAEWEPPVPGCPLRCSSSRKIPKLTVKVYWLYYYMVCLVWVLALGCWNRGRGIFFFRSQFHMKERWAIFTGWCQCYEFPSVLWDCWLCDEKDMQHTSFCHLCHSRFPNVLSLSK